MLCTGTVINTAWTACRKEWINYLKSIYTASRNWGKIWGMRMIRINEMHKAGQIIGYEIFVARMNFQSMCIQPYNSDLFGKGIIFEIILIRYRLEPVTWSTKIEKVPDIFLHIHLGVKTHSFVIYVLCIWPTSHHLGGFSLWHHFVCVKSCSGVSYTSLWLQMPCIEYQYWLWHCTIVWQNNAGQV